MVTLVDLTGNLADLTGGAYTASYAKVWIETNVNGFIVDGTGNKFRASDATATLTADGAFTFADLWATNSATNPTSFQYRVFIEYAPRRPGSRQSKLPTWDSGWFSLTATSDLADVVEEQYAPPSWQTTFMADAQALLDAQEAISGLTGEDDAVALLVADKATDTGAAVSDRLAGHVNGFRDMVDKLRNQQQDVNLLIVGDSTADMTTGGAKWTTGLAAALGALFPTHTVKERSFDYTTTNDWNAATTVQTGTGYRSDLGAPKTLTVWVAGWAGHNWSDWLVDTRRDKLFGSTTSPDVMLFGLGHNDGTANMDAAVIRSRDLAYIEWARQSAPKAQVILSSQNPRIGVAPSLSPGHAELRNDIYRSLARERGYGYINITQAFYDDGRSLVPGAAGGLIEGATGVHPSQPDGYDLWRDTFVKQVKAATGAVPLPTSVPAFTLTSPRVVGMETVPVLSNGWTGTNVTEAIETTIVRDGASRSVKLTKTAGGSNSRLERSVPVAKVKGKDITLRGWVYVPSASTVTQVGIYVDGSLVASSLADQVMTAQWYPIALTTHVPTTAATVTARLWVDNSTSGSTPSIYVDELDVLIGSVPLETASTSGGASGTIALGTWATGTTYSTGDLVSFGGALYQATTGHTAAAAFRTDLGSGNWQHVGGHGRVESINPAQAAGYTAFTTVNRAYYYRIDSAAAISNLLVEIGTQSGNILAAIYANNGSQGRAAAPGTKIADTGSVACPAVGLATLTLGGTYGVAAGDWLMLAADNTTVRFRCPSGFSGAAGLSTGRVGYEALASLAAPASGNPTVWAPTYVAWVAGS